MNKLLIGVCRRPGAGKHHVTTALADALDLRIFTLTGKIKRACAATLNLEPFQFNALKDEHYFPTVGMTKQEYISVVANALTFKNKRFLIDSLRPDIEAEMHGRYQALSNGCVIGDVCLQHETDWIRDQGGILIFVKHSKHDLSTSVRTSRHLLINPHDDYVIQNNANTWLFNQKIEATIEAIKHQIAQPKTATEQLNLRLPHEPPKQNLNRQLADQERAAAIENLKEMGVL